MKRILFAVRDFNHGGIPKCMQQLIELIDKETYEIDIFCGDQRGPYKDLIKGCNIINQNSLILMCLMNYRKEQGSTKFTTILVKSLRHCLLRLNIDILNLLLKKEANKISITSYDAVIAYAEGLPAELVSKIDCDNKLLWIHNDYKWRAARDQNLNSNLLLEFNKIVCVSKHAVKAFTDLYPKVIDRTTYLHNPINVCKVKKLAEQGSGLDTRFTKKGKSIISVGRLSYQKNFNVIPGIASELRVRGLIFKWFIIGDGPDKEIEDLKSRINEFEVNDIVVLLGPKDNPYPYMTKSDLYVLTSHYETYPTVINEAKILGLPIVCSSFNGVEEIMNSDYGVVCKTDEMANSILSTLKVNKADLPLFQFSNEELLCSFYKLVDI